MIQPGGEIAVRLERAITQIEEHTRRLEAIEEVQPAVLAQRVTQLTQELQVMNDKLTAQTRSFYTVAGSIVVAAVTLAFTAFQIVGTGP